MSEEKATYDVSDALEHIARPAMPLSREVAHLQNDLAELRRHRDEDRRLIEALEERIDQLIVRIDHERREREALDRRIDHLYARLETEWREQNAQPIPGELLETAESPTLERIATALERLAAIGNCVAVFEDGERLMVQQVQS